MDFYNVLRGEWGSGVKVGEAWEDGTIYRLSGLSRIKIGKVLLEPFNNNQIMALLHDEYRQVGITSDLSLYGGVSSIFSGSESHIDKVGDIKYGGVYLWTDPASYLRNMVGYVEDGAPDGLVGGAGLLLLLNPHIFEQ